MQGCEQAGTIGSEMKFKMETKSVRPGVLFGEQESRFHSVVRAEGWSKKKGQSCRSVERALGPVLGQVPLQGRGGVRWPTRSVREWGPFLRPAVLVPVPRSSPRPPRL